MSDIDQIDELIRRWVARYRQRAGQLPCDKLHFWQFAQPILDFPLAPHIYLSASVVTITLLNSSAHPSF